jgi:hypothetical protein
MKKLGYTPYHTMEAYYHPRRDFPLWEEALKAKFLGEGKPYGREEFDKLLGNFDVSIVSFNYFVSLVTNQRV